MAVPNFQKFMLPVLKGSAKGEVKLPDIASAVATELGLSDADLEELVASGTKTAFNDRIAWAKAYLKQAGLVSSTRRAFFSITPAGTALLESNPTSIDINLLKTFPEFMQAREKKLEDEGQNSQDRETRSVDADPEIETPYDKIRSASRLINSTLGQDIIERLRLAPPAFFERVIVQLLLAMGYGGTYAQAGKAIGKSGDNGVDGVIDQDTLGLDRVYVQAKRYAENVTVSAGDIRDFFGSLDMHKAAKGLFVTTSTFTKFATETAEKLGKRIVLIDGNALAALMIRFNVGCRVEEVVEIKRIDEEFFE